MKFKVIPYNIEPPKIKRDIVLLHMDGWDDWFRFNTMYNAYYYDSEGKEHRIGEVKIGEFNMKPDQKRANIPHDFEGLGEKFFSLGQDDSYYEVLNNIGSEFRNKYLSAMRDVAKNKDLFELAQSEDVTGISLLRSVSDKTVTGQFRRMTGGGSRLTPFSFSFTPPAWGEANTPPTFKFEVIPDSSPPTNVHILIGRNAVGKTHTVNAMINSLVKPKDELSGIIEWEDSGTVTAEDEAFSNIISITFSAFDQFEPLSTRENRLSTVRYQYVGLKHISKEADGSPKPPKSPSELATDFGKSIQVIVTQDAKSERWERAISLLSSDKIFDRANVQSLVEEYEILLATNEPTAALSELRKIDRSIFAKLSSGHKIVLLTITRLVEVLEDRSIVLVDEPEAHLHPPLLSAFTRSLSDLLINRNGVAIIATHSPVILQEVPKTCVWRMRRNGHQVKVERPLIETFGENVGTLTHAIFGLEVTDSGFHKMISEAVDEGLSYDEVISRFNDQLGDEARGIARSLIATRQDQA